MWEDFVNLDDSDIDWNDILEEEPDYVAAEYMKGDVDKSESEASSHSQPSTTIAMTSVRAAKNLSNIVYECPTCTKQYKSASGFRGHVKTIHNQDLKASKYKCQVGKLHKTDITPQQNS
ncbi:uncharacterized protein LOC144345913, partial [Saccoglossus kowalevskii]